MGDVDAALQSYEQALRINQWSIPAMQSISCILRTKEQFPNAVEYLRTILSVDKMNGEVWGNLGMTMFSHITSSDSDAFPRRTNVAG